MKDFSSNYLRRPDAWKARLLAFCAYPVFAVSVVIVMAALLLMAWPLLLFWHRLPQREEDAAPK